MNQAFEVPAAANVAIQFPTTFDNLNVATDLRVLYEDPLGNKGYFPATASGLFVVLSVLPSYFPTGGTDDVPVIWSLNPQISFGALVYKYKHAVAIYVTDNLVVRVRPQEFLE